MKKFTKTLSIVLLIAMCMSMFTVSAFAAPTCDGNSCDRNTTLTYVEGKAATCSADGVVAHYECICGKCFDGSYGVISKGSTVIPADASAHAWRAVAAVAGADCMTPGKVAYNVCDNDGCGKFQVGGALVDSVPAGAVGSHSIQQHAAVAATCGDAGNKAYAECTTCGKLFNSDLTVEVTEADIIVAATGTHSFAGNAPCSVCGAGNPDHAVFTVSGTTPAEFSNTGVYVYEANHRVTGVSAGGYPLYEGQGFYFANGKVTVNGNAVASLISGKNSVELVFTAEDGCTAGGFYLNNQTTVESLKVDGFEQRGFIKGSTEAVTFKTNDSNPNNVKLYSTKTQKFVDLSGNGSYPLSQVGNMYTYTFGKAFLDTLDAGTYYVQCYYGANSYVTAGTIVISLSNSTTGSTSLTFTNSTVSNTEYKYVSGGAGPKLFSELFRDKACSLQVSTNGGTSWKNVSVYDYYIEQANNKDTSYAWIKTAYLDSMPASSNVYFRVIVPASARGTTTDAVSNWVKVTTGNTLAAVDTNKHVINSSKNLRFVSSAKIESVYVGNINLTQTEPNAYSLSADGKYVTLHAEFLNKRTAGSTYTLTVLTKDGEKLSTTFQILTTAQASASPRTGDDSNIALWTAVLMLSAGAAVAVLPRLKKEQ